MYFGDRKIRQVCLKYIDKLQCIFNQEPSNALILGSAMHFGIEKSVEDALDYYKSQYAIHNRCVILYIILIILNKNGYSINSLCECQ